MWAKLGGGLRVCSEKCRAAAYRKRQKQSTKDYRSEIQFLKQRIKELENEN